MMAEAVTPEIIHEHAGAFCDPSTHVEGKSIAAWRQLSREHLQLPNALVCAAGHQAQAWHPGIVAKTMWTDARARKQTATALHIVVDQDEFDGLFVEWPEMCDGFWTAAGHRFAHAANHLTALSAPAFRPRPIEHANDAPEYVRAGLQTLESVLASHAHAANAPMQVTLALLQGLHPYVATPRVLCASQLMQTEFARHLLERMINNPAACALAMNTALALHPRSARALVVDGERSELPLWLLDESGQKLRANGQSLRSAVASGQIVLPRATFLGVVARTALADEWTHGLGGKIYEQVSDRWIQLWLGWQPPGFTVVSATLRLPLESVAAPAVQAFRSAWCDPEMSTLSTSGPSARRQLFLNQIAALPRQSQRRRSVFEALIADRHAQRLLHTATLARLKESQLSQQRAQHSQELTQRRSWCAVLYPQKCLQELHSMLWSAAQSTT